MIRIVSYSRPYSTTPTPPLGCRVERDAPAGYVRSAFGCPQNVLRRFSADTPRQTVRAVFPHTALRVEVVFIAPVPRTFSESFHFGRDGIVQLGQAVCGSPHHLRIAPFDSPFGQYISYPHVLCLPFSRRGPSLHGHCPASPLLRPHPTTAFAFANCSPPKFPCRTFGKCRPLCPAASTLPESSQQGDVGFTSTETLTTRKHLTRLYVGSSLTLRPIPLSGKTPAHRSPFARLAVLIVCRFLYDIAPSAISSAELCLAYLWQFTVAIKSDPPIPRVICHAVSGNSIPRTVDECLGFPFNDFAAAVGQDDVAHRLAGDGFG